MAGACTSDWKSGGLVSITSRSTNWETLQITNRKSQSFDKAWSGDVNIVKLTAFSILNNGDVAK